ncbi:MAG TPA: hypothetical protein PLT03_07305 [Bacillota bacterium]|nr:hypothetical protein [Bacillota bacterium]HOG53665.1 hypothetical protein [Bacillota bacterium]
MLEKFERAARLLDLYKGIISDKQRMMCSQYFLDNLSLSEIAENEGISRQAVHDGIERGIETMEAAERSLRLIEKSDKLIEILEEIKCLAASVKDEEISGKLLSIISGIDAVTGEKTEE